MHAGIYCDINEHTKIGCRLLCIYIELPDDHERTKGTFTDAAAALLPTLADCDAVQQDLVILVVRPSLQVFQDLVPHHTFYISTPRKHPMPVAL